MAIARPSIWGVVNVTPDSFSDGGRFTDPADAVRQGVALAALGADVIDVGGESTRPGAGRVPVADELARVLPVVSGLAEAGVTVSIDTSRSEVATAAVDAGASIVNDVSGGRLDDQMFPAVAAAGCDVVIMHWRALSDHMDAHAVYDKVTAEVIAEVSDQVAAAVAAGISTSRIIVDPGFGFAKDATQNWDLLAGLGDCVAAWQALGVRCLVGTSRKRFIGEALAAAGAETDPADRDVATAMTSVLAAQAGAWGVRVHSVRPTLDALAVWQAFSHAEQRRSVATEPPQGGVTSATTQQEGTTE